jgi:predicted O-linked N-acetylglucosamine transferase (SPINDLY family)
MTDLFQSELDGYLARLVTLLEAHNYPEAASLAEEALRRFPDSAELLRIYAITLHQVDRRDEALQLLYKAEKTDPDNLHVQCNLASFEVTDGRADEAIERMRAALRVRPGHPIILLTLGNTLMAAARYEQASDSYAMAISAAPDHPGLPLRLALAEMGMAQYEAAAMHASEAIKLAPKIGAAHAVLGRIYRLLNRHAEAVECFLHAEKLEPTESEHSYIVGVTLDEMGRLDDAQKAYARALQRNPSNGAALSQRISDLRRLCRWDELELLSTQLRTGVAKKLAGIAPFAFLAEDASTEEQLLCAKNFASIIEAQMTPLRQQMALNHPALVHDTPIRIGFVSDGFGEHPVGLFVVALMEKLKPTTLEIHFYATAPSDGGNIRKRLEATGKMHAVESLSHLMQAQRIHDEKIEILFDLNVYCNGSSSQLFALRPAPLQVNWLGYPGSSGASWIDYMMADAVVQPDSSRKGITEKLVRLPRCFQPYDTTFVTKAPPDRSACGLPENGIVFACFKATYKINPQAFACFMSILAQVESSVLWLLSGPEDADQQLRKQAALAGIDATRLIFMPNPPYADYISRYQHVDLFLDTPPSNARNTVSDALWSGCPVVTYTGKNFSGRVAASLLIHADLPELVAEDEASFVALAVSLGGNHEALQLVRHHLQQQKVSGQLFDMAGYASDFQRAVRAMVARHRIGRPAADIDIK